MGQTMRLRCHACGEEFERNYGIGIMGNGTMYCNQCGKAKLVDLSCGWEPIAPCDCGGEFDADALGCCPHCGILLEKEDVIN